MSTLGQRIKTIRKQNAVTQQEFSQRICVSQSYLSRLESDKEAPTEMLLKLIALEFNVSLGWLTNESESMMVQENTSDYFERGQPAIIGSVDDNYQRIASLISKAESPYLEMSISSILQQIECLINMFPKDPKRSDILIEEMAGWCIDYVEFLECSKSLDMTSTDGLRDLYHHFYRFAESSSTRIHDVLKSYEKTLLQQ